MTSFSTKFTKEDFLSLPEYVEKRDAPKDKTAFVLKGKYADQKETLLTMIENLSKANTEDLQANEKTNEILKVLYVIRHKDGNISERGGFIEMSTIIKDILRKTVVNDAPKVGTEEAGILTIDTGS